MRKSSKGGGRRGGPPRPGRSLTARRATRARIESDSQTGAGQAGLPDKKQLLEFIQAHDGAIAKRDIARAFGLKSEARVELKRMLRELADEGQIARKPGRSFHEVREGSVPPVLLLEVVGVDDDGELTAKPVDWRTEGVEPKIVLAPPREKDPALAPGDRFLGRMAELDSHEAGYSHQASLLKKLPTRHQRMVGLFQAHGPAGRILPVDKRGRDELAVEPGDTGGARDGELVEVEALPGRWHGLRRARVIERLGDSSKPRSISMIAIHEQGLPTEFSPDAMLEAERAEALEGIKGRVDLRAMPLVTIDPADARDHDDAVYAEADPDPSNPDGWLVTVAIADVAHYVRPDSALDADARERGNSAYFPDRVVPMLPDRLSGDLCSLHEGVDRPCLCVRMTLSADGARRGFEFFRAVMRSAASLTYDEVQAAWEGETTERTAHLLDPVIAPLYGAYHAAEKERNKRSPLDLDLPERKVILAPSGEVESIRFRDRFDAHKLIEEFMILANVCAAEALVKAGAPLLFRVHDDPAPEKIESLREVLATIDIPLPKGQRITTQRLNGALGMARGTTHAELVNMSVLRAQAQAFYGPEHLGHFGLSLRSYAHFTSPIRRYADLIVHRALVAALKLGGEGGALVSDPSELAQTAEHISMTERRAMTAERDTVDRFLAAYLAERAGSKFGGRIAGVQSFGLFVKLDESGADGFTPISTLGDEFFHYDEAGARLVGERSGVELKLGQKVVVELVEATPMSGGLLLKIIEPDLSKGSGRRGGKAGRGPVKPGTRPVGTARHKPGKKSGRPRR